MVTDKILKKRTIQNIQDALTWGHKCINMSNIGNVKDTLDPAGQMIEQYINTQQEVAKRLQIQ